MVTNLDDKDLAFFYKAEESCVNLGFMNIDRLTALKNFTSYADCT